MEYSPRAQYQEEEEEMTRQWTLVHSRSIDLCRLGLPRLTAGLQLDSDMISCLPCALTLFVPRKLRNDVFSRPSSSKPSLHD